MLGFPKNTEINKILPKKAIYEKFQLSAKNKEQIEQDISRIIIVNEITAQKLKVSDGTIIKGFYVLLVALKRKNFDEKSIAIITKVIPQNIIMVLQYEQEAKIVIFYSK